MRRRTDTKPQTVVSRVPPDATHLPFLGVAPDWIHFVSDLRTTDVTHAVAWVSISLQQHEIRTFDSAWVCTGERRRYLPSCKDHDVCFELRPICESESSRGEVLDSASVLEPDVAVDELFACASVFQKDAKTRYSLSTLEESGLPK